MGTLAQSIIRKYDISPDCVVGYFDIGFHPENGNDKIDPGPLFPWKELYEQYGVGVWLTPQERSFYAAAMRQESLYQQDKSRFVLEYMKKYGYQIHDANNPESEFNKKAFLAFRSHFSKNGCVDFDQGSVSGNDCAWAYGLVKKYRS